MVANMCVSALAVIGSCCVVQSLWLTMRMVAMCVSFLVAIRAQ